MNKTIKNSLLLLIASTIFATLVFYIHIKDDSKSLVGRLVFAKTAEQGTKLNKIVITGPEQKTTLELKDNYWKVIEGDEYYADLSLTNSLFNAMNNSRYFSEHKADEDIIKEYNLETPLEEKEKNQNAGNMIQTYVGNELIDQIIIGDRSENKLYAFAKQPDFDSIWLISNYFNLPKKRFSWFQQPLLNYTPDSIKSFKLIQNQEDASFYRTDKAKDFMTEDNKPAHLKLFSEYFTYLIAHDVKKAQHFDLNAFPKHKKIELELFSGLITDIDIYTDDITFWIKIKIYADAITTFQIKDYIQNNEFLYDGWYFNIAEDTGRILYNSLKIKNDDTAKQ